MRLIRVLAVVTLLGGLLGGQMTVAGAQEERDYREVPFEECPDDERCAFPTPNECASGDFNGVWDGGPTGRGSICAGADGTIVLYTGGNAQTPCGTIIVADQTLTGDRGGDPHTECPE